MVVEAGLRSGAANTAAWTKVLGRVAGAFLAHIALLSERSSEFSWQDQFRVDWCGLGKRPVRSADRMRRI